MNTDYFIARKLLKKNETGKRFSKPVLNIALAGIALGLAVMILSMAIVSGFKNEIRTKIFGFGSHLQILNHDSNNSYETEPIFSNAVDTQSISKVQGVKHIQPFATKAGIIKSNDLAQGIVLKGVDDHYDWSFFNENLVSGSCPKYSNNLKSDEIVISKSIASLLNVKIGDKINLYFIENPPRMRKFLIKGIYQSHMDEFDKMFVLCDLKHVQKLNNWNENQISGYEISINDFELIHQIQDEVSNFTSSFLSEDGSMLKIQTIMEKYPYLFDWIGLFNTNLWVIFILLTLVSGFNMISGLLVLILERTPMIGILKAIGYSNLGIRKIFLYQSVFLIQKGLIWGNSIGLLIIGVQYYFKPIKLDKASYYIEYMPVSLNIYHLVLLNIAFIIVVLIMLIMPSLIISRISPIKAIKFN